MPQTLFLSLGILFAALCLIYISIKEANAGIGALSCAVMASACFVSSALIYIARSKK